MNKKVVVYHISYELSYNHHNCLVRGGRGGRGGGLEKKTEGEKGRRRGGGGEEERRKGERKEPIVFPSHPTILNRISFELILDQKKKIIVKVGVGMNNN